MNSEWILLESSYPVLLLWNWVGKLISTSYITLLLWLKGSLNNDKTLQFFFGFLVCYIATGCTFIHLLLCWLCCCQYLFGSVGTSGSLLGLSAFVVYPSGYYHGVLGLWFRFLVTAIIILLIYFLLMMLLVNFIYQLVHLVINIYLHLLTLLFFLIMANLFELLLNYWKTRM